MTVVHRLHVLAAVRSPEIVAALSEGLGGLDAARVTVVAGPLAELRASSDPLTTPDVMLAEVDPADDRDVEALERLMRHDFPALPVLVTAAQATLGDVRRLMRLGVADFLPQPIGHADLLAALEHVAHARRDGRAPPPRGHVLAFLKAGGGVGATTLAAQAAVSLATRRRAGRGGVCLLDLDIQFGAAALYLDLDDRIGLADVLDAPARLDGELLRSVMAQHRSGLDLLAAPRELVGLEAITPEVMGACLDLASAEYQTVLLDLPGVWTPWSYRAVQRCDLVLLVAQLNVAGVRQARRQLDAMAANGLSEVTVKVVINRFENGWRRQLGIKDAEQALGRKIDYLVANDYRTVSAALNQGTSLADIRRRSKTEVGIRRMIDAALRSLEDAPIGGGERATLPRLAAAHRV